jgi:hypothetical protein
MLRNINFPAQFQSYIVACFTIITWSNELKIYLGYTKAARPSRLTRRSKSRYKIQAETFKFNFTTCLMRVKSKYFLKAAIKQAATH